MDISKMSIVELKALAYDLIAKGELNQKDLQTVNQAIMQKSKEPKVEPVKE